MTLREEVAGAIAAKIRERDRETNLYAPMLAADTYADVALAVVAKRVRAYATEVESKEGGDVTGASTCCHTCRHRKRALKIQAENARVLAGRRDPMPCPARSTPCCAPADRSRCADGAACTPCKGWRR